MTQGSRTPYMSFPRCHAGLPQAHATRKCGLRGGILAVMACKSAPWARWPTCLRHRAHGALLRILEGFSACVGRVELGLRLRAGRVVCGDRCAVALVEGRAVPRRGQLGDPRFQRLDRTLVGSGKGVSVRVTL